MKMKRMAALLTAAAVLIAGIPAGTFAQASPGGRSGNAGMSGYGTVTGAGAVKEAEGQSFVTEGDAYVNPVYEDVVTADDLVIPSADDFSDSSADDGISTTSVEDDSIVYYETTEEAGEALRAGMKAREETITVYYYGEAYSYDYFKELCTEYIIPEALAETEYADEGDYLRYNYGGTGYRASITADGNGDYRYYTIIFTPTYYTTAEQEAEMTAAVDSLLEKEFAFQPDETDYEQLYAVYDYICSNVTYDSENLSDSTYTLKYTAYAALMNGTAVCQGYAALYYRLLRELGFSVRVATGYGGASSDDESDYYENHAWNIVQIDGKWYYADSTWDAKFSDEVAAGTCTYQYFLKGTSDFDILDEPYSTTGIHYLMMDEDFTETYSIEETKYLVSEETACTHENTEIKGTVAATCTGDGYTGDEICTVCGETVSTGTVISAAGHNWDSGIVTKEATTEEEGIMTYTCTVCGETKTETIEKLTETKELLVPSVTLTTSQNNGKIRMTGTITGYGDTDNCYEVTGEGFVYITKAKLGAKSLSVNTSGRTKVTITSATSAAIYSYSMTPTGSSTVYAMRAWITYKNSSGKTVYVYSNTIYTSYSALAN